MKKVNKQHCIVLILMAAFVLCIFFLSWNQIQSRRKSTVPIQTEKTPTLEELLGEYYVKFLTDTITMQMENRMEKEPDIRYYPIADNAPLGNYVEIGETTAFEVDEEGYLTIRFPAGTVTAPEHGEQRFRVTKTDNAKD